MALFGRKKEQSAEASPWGFGEFSNFFNQEAGKKGNSEEFLAVARALAEYENVRNQAVSQESAMKLIAANQALMDACEAYANARKGAVSASGRARLDAVKGLVEFQKKQNLDEIRDMRVVREHTGKTWEQVGPIPMAEIKLNGRAETVGANVSRRLKVEYNGKKGFFTEQREVNSMGKSLSEMIEAVDKKKEPERRKALEENQELIASAIEKTEKTSTEEVSRRDQMNFHLADAWNQMETTGATSGVRKQKEKEKREFGKAVVADRKGMENASAIMNSFYAKVKEEGKDPRKVGSFRRMVLLEKAISENQAAGESLKTVLRNNKEILINLPAPEGELRASSLNFMRVKGELIQKKASLDENSRAGKKGIEQLDLLIKDDKTIHEWSGMKIGAESMRLGASVTRFEVDDGNELSGRNVASSRIAELLGVGNLIAHSRKMVVHAGDQTMTGSFMEFAEGTDAHSNDYVDLRSLSQVDQIETAGFNRDACNLEVLDYICGQADRHGANMFYKLSEPDENGKRSIVGLQGIDNDLAFGDYDDLVSVRSADIYEMTFIDRELAAKVKNLDRAALEYAVGDLIPEKQMDALEGRLKRIQERLKTDKMVELDPGEWELNEFNPKEYGADLTKSGLDQRGQNYVRGLRALEKSREDKIAYSGFHHKNNLAMGGIAEAKRDFESYNKEQDELYGSMREMFEREPEKGPAKEQVKEPAPRQRTTFADLGKTERPARKSGFLSEREKPERKKSELQAGKEPKPLQKEKQPERGMAAGKR